MAFLGSECIPELCVQTHCPLFIQGCGHSSETYFFKQQFARTQLFTEKDCAQKSKHLKQPGQ